MAELELSIRYRTAPARLGVTLMGALLPVWGLIVPFCMGLFVSQILTHPASIAPLITFMVVATMLMIPVLSVLATAICEDDRILVSKEGLAFPLLILPMLKFRRERLWSELAAISVTWAGGTDLARSDRLSLYFRDGGRAHLSLSLMSKVDLEELLLAIEVWGEHAEKSQDVSALQNMIQNQNKGIEHISYTQMWEEEMSRRFSATSFVPLEPGKTLCDGRLKVVRQLAFGGLSAIYLAQRDATDLVVLKEAVVPAGANEDARQRATDMFNREAQFLARLRHKRIARVEDHFVEQGRHYLLLEYVPGQDLRQLVKQHGAQPEEKVLSWAMEIAGILAYLHGQDPPIIHRDITPDNLVLREDGSLFLIDFGAANEFVGTATGTLVGKQAYIAPEQFRGKARTQSDLYSLGGTLYFLITASDPEPLSEAHPREKCPGLSAGFDDIVAALTRMEASERPQTAAAVLSMLEALGKPPLVGPVGGAGNA